jgi:hypothetical protein
MEKAMTIEQIIQNAKDLGIKLTSAEVDTDICQCWADRVELAARHFEKGNMTECQEWIPHSVEKLDAL